MPRQRLRPFRRAAWLLAVAAPLLIAAAALAWWPAPRPAAAPVPAPTSRTRVAFPAGRYPTLALPDGRALIVHSLLRVDHRLRYGDHVWDEAGVPRGPVWVRISLADQTVSVFRAGHEIGTAVILYGTDDKPTPTGIFPILERAEHHRSSLYDAEMPYMLRLTRDGVAVHASDVERGAATHGCIGVPIDFARLLFGAVKRGDPVAILSA